MYENLFMTPGLQSNLPPPGLGMPCSGLSNGPSVNDLNNPIFPGFMTSRPGQGSNLESSLPCFPQSANLSPPGPGMTGGGQHQNNSCHGCLAPIVDNVYLSVADFTTWHVPCLKCSDCSVGLDSEKSCFIKAGKYLCKKCYQRRFKSPSTPGTAVCARCNCKIHAREMVMHAKEFVYHVNCFNCTHCSRLLTTGDHFGMKDSLIFCRQHFEMLSSPPLNLPLHVNQHHPHPHPHPITSSPPNSIMPPNIPPQGGPNNFAHISNQIGGNPLSAIPGYSPNTCSPFSQHPLPMGYPNTQLGSDQMAQNGYPLPPHSEPSMMNHSAGGAPPKSQKGRPKKKKQPVEDTFQNIYGNEMHHSSLHGGAHDAVLGLYMAATNQAVGSAASLEQQNRTKRVRTSFKNHQLRVLKQYFQLNHNPDAKELKQLSQKTGLSKRVLQVWFQNARAKYRRLMMKNQQNGSSNKFSLDDENSQEQNMKISESDDEDDEAKHDVNNANSPSAESMSDFGEILSPDLSDVNSPNSNSFGMNPSEKTMDENNSNGSNFSLQDSTLNSNNAEAMAAF